MMAGTSRMKKLEVEDIYNRTAVLLETLGEVVASYSVGQFAFSLVDRALWTVQKSAEWSLSQEELQLTIQSSPEKSKNNVKPNEEKASLTRPLPWVLFIPVLMVLRTLRAGVSVTAMLIGLEPIQPVNFVQFVQKRRHDILRIKKTGKRKQRQRGVHCNNWKGTKAINGILDQMSSLICINRLTSQQKLTEKQLSTEELVVGADTEEQNPNHVQEEEQKILTDKVTMNLLEQLNKYVEEESEGDDPDYEPDDERNTPDDTISTEDDTAEESPSPAESPTRIQRVPTFTPIEETAESMVENTDPTRTKKNGISPISKDLLNVPQISAADVNKESPSQHLNTLHANEDFFTPKSTDDTPTFVYSSPGEKFYSPRPPSKETSPDRQKLEEENIAVNTENTVDSTGKNLSSSSQLVIENTIENISNELRTEFSNQNSQLTTENSSLENSQMITESTLNNWSDVLSVEQLSNNSVENLSNIPEKKYVMSTSFESSQKLAETENTLSNIREISQPTTENISSNINTPLKPSLEKNLSSASLESSQSATESDTTVRMVNNNSDIKELPIELPKKFKHHKKHLSNILHRKNK